MAATTTTGEQPDDGGGGGGSSSSSSKIAASSSTPERPSSYRPVVIVHGLMTGDVSTMEHLAARIKELHPGTKTYVINRFCGLASLEPLWRQTKLLGDELLRICSLHPEGVHIIGYSQGGLIARGMLEEFGVEHNVKTFVSLSSPQGGQFGAECFTKMFPALTARTAYEVFYTRLGQHSLSVANYWYDPRHRDLYLEYSVYLAIIDNVKQQHVSSLADAGDHPWPHRQTRSEDEDMDADGNDDDAVSSTTTADPTIHGGSSSSNVVEPVLCRADSSENSLEVRIAVAIAAVSAATLKVAEGHSADDDNSDTDSVSIVAAVDTTTMDDISDEADTLLSSSFSGSFGFSDSDMSFNAKVRKLGLTRLQRMVLIGGPDDGVISPWQSSQFAILDSTGVLIPMRERIQNDVFSVDDIIGLRQLDVTGRLVEYTVPGVGHHDWHCNEKVLNECIIKWLD